MCHSLEEEEEEKSIMFQVDVTRSEPVLVVVVVVVVAEQSKGFLQSTQESSLSLDTEGIEDVNRPKRRDSTLSTETERKDLLVLCVG